MFKKRLIASRLFRYSLSVLFVAASLLLTYLLQPYIFQTPLFFLSIMLDTWAAGIGPGIFAALLSALAILLFLKPQGMAALSFQNISNILVFLIAALLVGFWSATRRRAEQALQISRDELEAKVQERTADLNRSNQQLQQDITERKQAEEAALQQAKRAQLLADISKSFAEAGLDYQAVLDTITRRTAELIGDLCMILQLSDDRKRFSPVTFFHSDTQALAMMQDIMANTWKGRLDEPIPTRILQGETVYIPVFKVEEIRPVIPQEYWPFVERFGISSILVVPLRIHEEVIGDLTLARGNQGPAYTLDDAVLLQDLADRAGLEIENARLFQSVRERGERLRALSNRLVEARETERRGVARGLHDEIGQLLTGLQITLKMSSRLEPDAARKSLEESQKLVEQLLNRVQNLSLDLRPAVLDDLGLTPALLSQFERYTRQTGIQVHFDHRGIGRRFPANIETAAYRIVQEGLTNVARHAGVKEAAVRVWAEDGALGLQIEDQGDGFDVETVQEAHASSGLRGMQEQAELLGGQMTIESVPGAGTLITVELPLFDSLEGAQDERVDFVGG